MWIQIRLHGLRASRAFFEHTESRAAAALAHAREHVRAVRVHIRDDNGPRGGVDKRCRVELVLVRRGTLYTDARGTDARRTVDLALERSARALDRLIQRRADARRHGEHRRRLDS
jgi:ribosome-associated translation inhibitor RaiA